MASAYLVQKENEYKAQAQQEKSQISYQIQSQISQAQRDYKKPQPMSDSIPLGCLGSVVVTILLSAMVALNVGKIFVIGLIGTVVITIIAHSMRSGSASSHNSSLDRKIENLRQQETAQLKAVDEKYVKMLEQETNRFNNSVRAARSKYSAHNTAQPIVNWLLARFEKEIMSADRRPHNKNIEVVFAFRVDAHQLATLKKVNNTDQYGNAELFDFNVNRFHNLPDFEDRIGFSQAIAKLVQFNIMRRFPKDPVLASHAKPVVVITSNDTQMELRYQVANPKYRHAVTL